VEESGAYSLPAGTALLLHDAGVDVRNVLTRAGLPSDFLARGTVRLPAERYFELWRALEEEADDPLLPIRLGHTFSIDTFDPLIFAATCSRNLEVAAGRISTFKRLVAPMRLSIDRRADELSLTFEWLGEWPVPEVLVLSELTFVVALVRTVTRARVRPVRVATPSPPRPSTPFREYFGVPVQQAGTTSITFSAADASRPFLTVNDMMWQEFEPRLRARLADIDSDTSVATRVRASLVQLLPSGEASVGSVARMLALSVRSLQRQLQTEGTSFQRVLAETRESLARHYLDRGGLSNDEVAFLLGYGDARSFIRAFVARTGATPGEARRRSMAVSNVRR
jgi:AraC-like DNA-binding protein